METQQSSKKKLSMGHRIPLYIVFLISGPIIPGIAIIVSLFNRKKYWAREVLIAATVFFLLYSILIAIAYPNFVKAGHISKNRKAEAGIHSIAIALDRYAKDNDGIYPEDVNQLIESEYIDTLPDNPFNMFGKHVPMKQIDLGSEDYEGNFTYLPLTTDGKITGYYLIAYGSEKLPGDDINGDGQPDHVVGLIEHPVEGTTTTLSELLK